MQKINFSDSHFLQRLRAQDATAFEQLVHAYNDHIYKAGFGMGLSREDSREVCNSTWLTFFEVVPRFEGRSHIRTFLFGIFYNKVAEFKRSFFRFKNHEPIDDVMQARPDDSGHWRPLSEMPAVAVEWGDTINNIEDCMEKLPQMQKAVFTMKVVMQEDADTICNTLEISSTNLRQLLYRGKNGLRECLQKLGIMNSHE